MNQHYPIYSGIRRIPVGRASEQITPGCIVLEGGAFRGVYTNGVLDALMRAGINLQCTVGVSAGAMNGVNYVSGQIGRSARINLLYRHDSRYVGARAVAHNKGLIGFDFVFSDLPHVQKLDMKRFSDPARDFYAVVTNLNTGLPEFISKNDGADMFQAVRASASMPYISKPVMIGGQPYLDGGCSCKIPYEWALEQGYEKIIVVRTRHRDFRKKIKEKPGNSEKLVYRRYPAFAEVLRGINADYNRQCDEINRLEAEGRIFVIAPSRNIPVGRLEGDMEKLGYLYKMGYHDTKESLAALREYLF